MNGGAVSAKKIYAHFLKFIFIEICFLKNIFFDDRGSCKCEKYYTMLVHNLKTSKTGVFDVIKGVNSPPQARKKSLFHFFLHTVKGYTPPPWWGGWGLADNGK